MKKLLSVILILIISYFNHVSTSSIRLHAFISENKRNHSFEISYDKKEDDLKSQLIKICDWKKKTLIKLIVHGFAETWNMTTRWNWVDVLKNELLKSEDSTKLCILIVDWRELARGGDIMPNYHKAISNMNIAADLLTKFLGINPIDQNKMHC